jgi:hypothetical protein
MSLTASLLLADCEHVWLALAALISRSLASAALVVDIDSVRQC